GRRFEIAEETGGARVHDVLLGVCHSTAPVPAAVLCVGGGKQVVTTGGGIRPGRVVVGGRVITERVAGLREVQRGENRECVGEVFVLEIQQLAVFLVGEREAVSGLDRRVCFAVPRGGVRNAEQIV